MTSAATPTARAAASRAFSPDAVRADFPILSTLARGRPLVYLDSAATSQKPRVVVEAIVRFYYEQNANVHRSVHFLAERATTEFEGARAAVAQHLNAPSESCVVFTRGTTESANLIAHSLGDTLSPGDTVLFTEMEHHANLVPWHLLAKRRGVKLRWVPVLDDGTLDLEAARERLAEKPKLFAFTAKSNVLGTDNPVPLLTSWAREFGVTTFVDGAQSVPHGPVDVQAMGCDFFAFSAHKALGPMGAGALVAGRAGNFDRLGPFQGGGEMIRRVRLEDSTFAEAPLRFEAGTPAAADVIAMTAGLEYLASFDRSAIRSHEVALTASAIDGLRRLGATVLGPEDPEKRAGLVSFDLPGLHPHDISQFLDGLGIAVRAGHHCAQPLMRRFGVTATTRASFSLYNTAAEVDAFVDGVRAAAAYFRGRS